jgi:choline-sulfatase
MSDQHHAGVMRCAGDRFAHTPALDSLASRGVRFTNTYCPFPLCGPSRMSFLTGRHPYENALWDNLQELSSAIPTFAHAFLAADYDTILSGRMHFVGADQRHGFAQRLIADVAGTAFLSTGWKMQDVLGPLLNTTGMSLSGIVKSGPGHSGYIAYDQAVTRSTVQWLADRASRPASSQKPFMLTVGYVAPHCPFVAPPEDFDHYAALIKTADLPPYPPADALHPVHAQRRRNFQTDPPPPIEAQWRARVAYYGLCTFMDRQIAAVLDALHNAGLAENTIVVYTSDHGEMLGEHGMWWKSTFYDGACRVPLILSHPNSTPGIVNHNVSLMDLGPTLLDMCSLPPLPGATGKSFRSLLDGKSDAWDDTVFAENALPRSNACSRMVRSGPWKYNVYFGQGDHHNAPPELFNLQSDPGEINDLAHDPNHQTIRQHLHALVMHGWDPDRVLNHLGRASDEQKLIANWVNKTSPPEPDPLWFDKPQENHFDDTRAPT